MEPETRASVLHNLVCELRYFKTTPTTTTSTTTRLNSTTTATTTTTTTTSTTTTTTTFPPSPLNESGVYDVRGYGGDFGAFVDAETPDGPWLMVLGVSHAADDPRGTNISLGVPPIDYDGYSSVLLKDLMPRITADDLR